MPTEMGTRLAEYLLRKKGELSRSELAALLQDDNEIDLVISMLITSMNAKLQQRRVESSSIPEWEDYVVLSPAVAGRS